VPTILAMGAAEFAKIGVESAPGTAIFSISGNVVRPGNYELELGTPMRELIYDFAGGIADGRQLKAVIPGGSSVPALSPDQIDVPLDYDSLAAIGTFFGAASLIVVDDRCCMVQLALRSTKFYMHESCGKCTPCREGTRWMVQILERLEAGEGSLDDIELLESVGSRILGKSLCALGDFAVYPVASYIAKWGDEFRQHVELGRCPFEGASSIEGIVAPSDVNAHAPQKVFA
jgi:NADH-quinone oxidoreductase subunit F